MRWAAPAAIRLHLDSTPLAVREGLDRLLADGTLADLGEEARGTLWTVLAEVLNNVVEHAYAEGGGPIRLNLWRHSAELAVEVVDHGAPMPGLRLPEGKPHNLGRLEDLPEGGFGWFLIRSLTRGLVYDRVQDQNRLRFCLICD